MRKVGISDFEAFARDILTGVTEKPLSFEVFSDDFPEMKRQAMKSTVGRKMSTSRFPSPTRRRIVVAAYQRTCERRVKLNITAILTLDQVKGVAQALNSIMCGTGQHPVRDAPAKTERTTPPWDSMLEPHL